jgi:hypothetical protein
MSDIVSPSKEIMAAWFDLLTNVDPIPYPVYRYENINNDAEYIILRMDSDTWQPNHTKWLYDSVLIVECIKKVPANMAIDDLAVWQMDQILGNTIFDDVGKHNLPVQPNVTFAILSLQNRIYQVEADDAYKYFKIVSRYLHKLSFKN